MLVLARKVNEEIIINGNIKIVVIDIQGGKARIGIDCPKNITVVRGELHKFNNPIAPEGGEKNQ